MAYLKLNLLLPDPHTEPAWVEAIEDATPFFTRERAQTAKLRIADASGIIYDDHLWYVVRV